jgi:hypothetical protein
MSTSSYNEKYHLVIERSDPKTRRKLSTLTPFKSNDRAEVQAEHDRRAANGPHKGSKMRIVERTTRSEAAAARQNTQSNPSSTLR